MAAPPGFSFRSSALDLSASPQTDLAMETPVLDADETMLGRLAERDLAAAEHAHDRLLAADGAADIADLGLAYARFARSLRKTLALKARLGGERQATLREAVADRPQWTAAAAVRAEQRQRQVYEAVDAVIWAEHQARRLDRPDAMLARLLERLAAEAWDDRFADRDPATLAARICMDLGLPAPGAPSTSPDQEPPGARRPV
ncbi:MAG TPA: hypothetical protein VF495_26490 [Phenylobacterium sp.]